MTSRKRRAGRVCPHQGAFLLNNWLRRAMQPPDITLRPFINAGDTVVDLGCGPGFFTLPMARLAGPAGRVAAVDLQAPMLAHVQRKAVRAGLAGRIVCHHCGPARIGLDIAADFVLAWYMVHETPDPAAFLREVRTLLKPDGRLLVVEPKIHVRRAAFETLRAQARSAGLVERQAITRLLSRGVLLARA